MNLQQQQNCLNISTTKRMMKILHSHLPGLTPSVFQYSLHTTIGWYKWLWVRLEGTRQYVVTWVVCNVAKWLVHRSYNIIRYSWIFGSTFLFYFIRFGMLVVKMKDVIIVISFSFSFFCWPKPIQIYSLKHLRPCLYVAFNDTYLIVEFFSSGRRN